MSDDSRRKFRTQNIKWQARLQGVELASFRSRAAAFVIDSLLISAILLVPSLWSNTISLGSGQSLALTLEFGSLLSVGVAVLYFGFATYLGKGATVGKRVLGIRVVSLVHNHLSLWHCIERSLGYAASSLEAGFGFLQYFTHPNRQTVHDRIAETIVIASPSGKRKSAT